MGGTKLCLLLLVGTCALAQQDVGNAADSPLCLLAKRYKNSRRFVYNYEAETLNGVNGATDNKSGAKISCKVEVEVPQTCSFVLRTTECSLKEISDVDGDGNPVYRPAAGAQAFKEAMAKNPLKITVDGQHQVKVFPEDDEPINILNIKRGIVSTLMVPVMEEDKNANMPTVHGVCPTDYTVNAREDIATDVSVSRDLSTCDRFSAHRQDVSPLAFITGMDRPLSRMISSTQTCNYNFDNHKKHMTRGTCTEKHIFLPLSFQNEYGVSTVVKQTVTLQETARINNRIFNLNEANVRFLAMEAGDAKTPEQNKNAALETLKLLNTLSQTSKGEERASLFRRLVTELRGLKLDILGAAVAEMMDLSEPLSWQALVQCGTPECTSVMMKELRKMSTSALEVDAAVYALGLLPNPSPLMVADMLAMAQFKQSKPIMYALSNVVRKLYQMKGVTPEITAVSEFISSLLGTDCASDKDLTFLTLRVAGNMGDVLEAVNPSIQNTLVKCMRQPATTLSVQLAAIQAFRRMSLTDEARNNLQRVCQYPKGAVQKRLAAYLMLMKNPVDSDFDMVNKILKQEQNEQIKSFVSSHIYNIITSTDSEAQRVAEKLMDVLKDADVSTHSDYTTKSRNYKLGVAFEDMHANVQGNLFFDPSSKLPREVLLETTLNAFGFNMDVWEVGMQGKGFEPTVEALFGKNGFFPDTLSKVLYWTVDKIPQLEKWMKISERTKVHDNLMREIVNNFNKMVKSLQSQDAPEALAYLRFMGNELGYIKGSELKFMTENAVMYADILTRIIPSKVMANLMSSTKNEIFVHYIFMDNKFVLPTASGLPLTFALSGTFTPGAKGGLNFAPKQKELSFMPSVGVEFFTQMGVHVPEFVDSTVEMHTNMYHESALNAKITMDNNQFKFSIPAPQGKTRIFSISNKVLIVGAGLAQVIPHSDGDVNCRRLFSGVNYCIETLRKDTSDMRAVPYFPLNGETKFAVDISPSEEVTEYTATITYKLLKEGKDGQQRVDSLKLALRAEGAQPTEATATMKYNWNRNVFTTQIMIPDFDVEAGIKVGMTDSSSKGKSILIEISNKNIPQLSLIGRAKLQAMTDGMLQVQMLVPALKTDATLTATMSKIDGLTLEIKSDVKLSESSSVQAVTFKYGESQAEVQLMSNMNADTMVLNFYTETGMEKLMVLLDDAMEQRVVITDLKLRQIVNNAVEASNIWMNKLTSDCPYAEVLKNKMAEVEIPTLPENLFMNFESTFKYRFNQDHLEIRIPLPLGGKSSKELRIPPVVTTPRISVPQVGMEVAPKEIQIPTFTIPSEYDLIIPMMGMMEVSSKLNSNYYTWESTISAGKNMADSSSYEAKFDIFAESPIKILAFSAEGATKVTDTAEKMMKFSTDVSLKHMFINTSLNVLETVAVTDNLMSTGKYKMQTTSPLGVDTSLEMTTQLSLDSSKLSADINTDGRLSVGTMTATTTYVQTFSVEPLKRKAMLDSTLRMDSEALTIGNKIKASYANDELMTEWNTNMNSDFLKHTTKMSMNYKDVKLTINSDSVTKADERMLHSQVEFSAFEGQVSLRIENQADDTANRVYSLLTGSLNPSGLEMNTDGSVNIFSSLASHKATLTINTNGLTTSCTTTAQHSPMTFENVFHGGVDASGVTMSLSTKGSLKENKVHLNVQGKLASTEAYLNGNFDGNLYNMNTRNRVNFRLNEDGLLFSNNIVGSLNKMRTENTNSLSVNLRSFSLQSKTDNFLDMKNSYMHDITVAVEHYTASVIMKNDLKIMDVNFVNDAQFKVKPYNMELTGTTMGTFAEEQLKQTYEVKFVDMVLSAKSNTNGKLLGAQMTHTTDMELAGLNIKLNNLAHFNSPYLRMDSTIKTHVTPLTLNIDAIFNSDGVVYLYGQQSGNLYSKFLLKAEPMMFTHSLEYRASTTHELEGRPTIKTNMNNKFNSLLSLEEQSVSVKMTSNVNEHTFDQEISAYNNAEKMGIEMMGAASTPFFRDAIENYAISGFVKYDKRSEGHFIQIPFVEHLPELIEEAKLTMMRLMDYSMETLNDINTKYEISVKIQSKLSELRNVVDNFDFNLFVKDLRKLINSVENYLSNLAAKFPTDKVINVLKSIKEAIMAWIKKHDLSYRFKVIFAKVEEILSKYEVEKMIEAIMEEVLKIMKQYQMREHIQRFFKALQKIDIRPFFKQALVPLQEILNELSSIDYKLLIDNMTNYFMRMIQKIRSLDYNRFSAELKAILLEMSKIPAFGKLYGEFRVDSPHYKLTTTADLENTTTTSVTPEFKVNLNSRAISTLKVLDFTVDASAHVAAPQMRRLTISESVKVDQSSFNLDHKGTMNLYGLSAQANAETSANVNTEIHTIEFGNKAFFAVENGVSAKVETNYKANMNMPLKIFSETSFNQKAEFLVEDSTARLIINNMLNGKCMYEDNEHEAAHKSDLDLAFDLHTAKLTFTGATSRDNFKMNQNVVADICIFRHAIIEAKVEVESPVVKHSIAEVKFQAKAEDLRVDLTATHHTELTGEVDGPISNTLAASASPTGLEFDTKNKGNVKITLPFSLSGKMDLQNDISCIVNSEVQQARWTGLARFNQYKYSHFFTMDNGEREISFLTQMNGEANLDVLKELITIPEMTLPFVGIKTPKIKDFSLWSDTGLSYILTTTQQTFDMNSKLKYKKNPEVITIDVNMEPLVNAINTNVKTLHKKVLISKDKAAAMMAESYNKAKAEYEKYSIELPKTITVPAYRVPVMNVDVSTFTIPVPDFSLITVPSLHIPSALSKLTLPKITLPKVTSIRIPVLGDLTYEFNMKTAMITLKTDASLLNKDNLIVKLDASSASEFKLLNGKIEGSTTLDKLCGFKMVSLLAVKHSLLEGKHDGTIVLNCEDVATSITNSVKINLMSQSMEIHQEITGSPEKGLLTSLFTPSAGFIAVQMQTKRPAQLKARLFGRYPSQPSTDIDILAVKMSVMEARKLNLQTTWNTEIPYEMMLQVKKQVPVVTEMVSEPSVAMYKKMRRHAYDLGDSLEEVKEQGKVMFKQAFDKLATVKPSQVMTTVTENMITLAKGYQKRVEVILNAVVKFLRDTKFQIPGYEKKMSGLEIYQKSNAFMADMSEIAIRIIPEYISSVFRNVCDYVSTIEFTLPGSNYVVRGREILDDLFVAFKKIQDQVIVTVRKIGNIQLEDIISNYSAFMQFTTEQADKLFQTLKSQNVDRLYAIVADTYREMVNSPILGQVATQVEKMRKIVIEYLKVVSAKALNILSDIRTEKLQADIQSQIDFVVKRANAIQNDTIMMLKEKSKAVEPFVRVEDRQVEIDIPLPFLA